MWQRRAQGLLLFLLSLWNPPLPEHKDGIPQTLLLGFSSLDSMRTPFQETRDRVY